MDNRFTLETFFKNRQLQREQILAHASFNDLITLTKTSSTLNTLFKKSMTEKKLAKLLPYVVHAQQSEVEKILTANPELLLEKCTIKDHANRTFEKITVFQYALWALDWHMWQAMLNTLPINDKGERLKNALLHQYEEIENAGIIYKYNGEIYNENYFSFQLLINSYHEYHNYIAYQNNSIEQNETLDILWQQIGKAQRAAPLHVINEYCRFDRSFHPTPTFNEKTLPRCIAFDGNDCSWVSIVSRPKFRDSFTIMRGDRIDHAFVDSQRVMDNPTCLYERRKSSKIDFKAINSLWKIRVNNFKKLKEMLLNPFSEPVSSRSLCLCLIQ